MLCCAVLCYAVLYKNYVGCPVCGFCFIGWSRNFRILDLLWSSLGKKAGFQFFLQLLGMDFLLVGRDDRLGEDCRLDLLIHARFCPISHGVCAWFRGCLAYPTVSGQTTIDVECRHVVVGSRGHLVTW